ncbi:hypothetical protein N0V83_005286 [Neocucurbitaria cava]|uniref:Ribonuclease H n=1 Tax=Neocucurbitaria cava TaxID=798079 RepID=A0A9W8Y9D3_9PLEO|nr:hypothetical protein N0V83_005286 [Neocucurbitaria cava]
MSAPTWRADVPGASKLFSGLTRRDAFGHQRKGLQQSLSLYANQKSEDMEPRFWKYYAVAVGRTPGLYSHWDDAREQVMGFKGSRWEKFMDRSDAIQFMREYGFADAEIRVFRKTFKPSSTFEPNPTATFQDEFKAFAATQTWKQEEARKAKVDTIVGELIYHYLPEGIAADQEDEDGAVDLTDEQALKIYQGMCRSAGKPSHPRIDNCLLELKKAPYVNIIDFVNTFRTGQEVQPFARWIAFREYTLQDGHRIDIQYAKENEFLAPLLQDLRPGRRRAVCPIQVRRDFVARKAKKPQQQKHDMPPPEVKVSSSMIPEICLSPPASDFSPPASRSPTPDLDDDDPISALGDHADTTAHGPHIKLESPSPDPIVTPDPPSRFALAAVSKEEDDVSGFLLPEGLPLSSQLEERHLRDPPPSSQMEQRHRTPMASAGKRPCASMPANFTPSKRARRIDFAP